MQVVFKPRLPMGIFVSDVQGGRVSGVLDGQAKEQGLEPSGLQSEFQDWISFQFFSTFPQPPSMVRLCVFLGLTKGTL